MEQAIAHLRSSLKEVESEIHMFEQKLPDPRYDDIEKDTLRDVIGKLKSKALDFQEAVDTLTDVQRTRDRA